MKTTQNETASSAYQSTIIDMLALLQMLSEKIKEKANPQKAVNWADVGSLKHYKNLLKEVIMAMDLPVDMYEDDFLANLEERLTAKRNGVRK